MRGRRMLVWAAAMLATVSVASTGYASQRPDPRAALADLGEALARGDSETVRARVDLEPVVRGLVRDLYDRVPKKKRSVSRKETVAKALEAMDEHLWNTLKAFHEHYEGIEDLSSVSVPDAAGLLPATDASEYGVLVEGDEATVHIPVTGVAEDFNQFWRGAPEKVETIRLEMSYADGRWRVVGAGLE